MNPLDWTAIQLEIDTFAAALEHPDVTVEHIYAMTDEVLDHLENQA